MKKYYKKIILSVFITLACAIVFFNYGLFENSALAETTERVETATGLLGGKMIQDENGGGVSGQIAQILSWLVLFMAQIVGKLLTWLTDILVKLFAINNFNNIEGVIIGWTIIRDLCNMFFILGFIIIAFATILRVESYSLKSTLPKLIIAAIVINFSRTICGLLIDFSQVITLTFANGIGYPGFFMDSLGINKILTIKNDLNFELESWAILQALFLALILLIIALFVIVMFVVVLLGRIIMFWILTILSPLAFFAYALPGTKQLFSKWWGEFSKYLIVGPVIAFFTWLSIKISSSIGSGKGDNILNIISDDETAREVLVFLNYIASYDNIMKYMISIGLLVGTLKITSSLSVIGGNVGMDLANRSKSFVGNMAKRGALGVGKFGLWGAKKGVGWGTRKFSANVMEIRPSKIIEGIKESFEKSKRDDDLKAKMRGGDYMSRGGLLGVVGGMGSGRDYWDRYLKWGGKRNLVDDFKSKGAVARLSKEQQVEIDKKDRITKEIEDLGSGSFSTAELLKHSQQMTANQKRIEDLENFNDELIMKLKVDVSKDDLLKQKEEIEQKLGVLKIERMKISPPKSGEVRSSYRSLVEEEKKKISSITNADELLGEYESAKKNKDKYRVAAIAEKLFNDANGNELMNHVGKASNAVGLRQFITQDMAGSGLFNEREGLMLQNDLSEAAERVGHWEMAKTVGMNEKGEMESLVKQGAGGKWDDKNHVLAAAAEIYKIDPQVIARTLNRLAMGGEIPDGKGGRSFELSNLGVLLLHGLSDTFANHEKRMLQNVFANLSQPQVVKQMKESGVSEQTINIMIGGGLKRGESTAPGPLYEKLKREGNL